MRFQKPKGQRLHKRFWGVQVDGYWWMEGGRAWIPMKLYSTEPNAIITRWEEWIKLLEKRGGLSNTAPCRSLRAFKRMIRKNPFLRGRARLISRFQGYDVWA